MALGFFRRRQKMVFWIMVVLMVAFLIPQGIQGFLRTNPTGQVLGTVGSKDITQGMLQSASADLELLRSFLRLGEARQPRRGEQVFQAFMQFNMDSEHRGQLPLTWALLLLEAQDMGVRVTDQEVSGFLAESGLGETNKAQFLAELQQQGYTEPRLRQAVADYFSVVKSCQAALLTTPPTLQDLRRIYWLLREQIAVGVAAFPAADFLKTAPEPNAQTIARHFEKCREFTPGESRDESDFGFGYRLPDRVAISWMFFHREALEQSIEPSELEMSAWWQKHQGELTTRPSQQAQDNDKTEVKTEVIKEYADAKPLIRKILKDQPVEARMSELINRAREEIARHAKSPDAYPAAAAAMIRPADDLLARPSGRIPFDKATLGDLIPRLAKLSSVTIVYPFGTHDKLTVSDQVVVSVEPAWEKLSLGEVLAAISAQLKIPAIKWVACATLDGVIFPSEPVNLVPVRAGSTGLADYPTLQKDPLLSTACQSPDQRGETVLSLAENVFVPPEKRKIEIKTGEDFPQAMFVVGDRPGRLIWRLDKYETAHSPEKLTPEIRGQVVKDLKLKAALEAAQKAAEDMQAKLDKAGPAGDLEKLATANKREYFATAPFPRRAMYLGQIYPVNVDFLIKPSPEEKERKSEKPKETRIGVSPLFTEKAFSLAPKNIEPPYPDKPSTVVALPRQEKVLLVQRLDFVPATGEEFAKQGVEVAAMALGQGRHLRGLGLWLSGEGVKQRLDYRPKSP